MDQRQFYLDTNVLIALIEPVRPMTQAQRSFVDGLDAGDLIAATSEMSLSECLVKPFADAQPQTVEAYLIAFAHQPWLRVLPVTRDVLIEAAHLRAESRMALPDAIHVASARLADCETFVSDDKRLKAPQLAKASWTNFPETS